MTGGVSFSADVTQKPASETNPSQKAAHDKGTTQPLIVLGEKQVSPVQNQAPDYKADYYAKADLDAQERMAAEAERLAKLTDSQLSVTIAEAILLGLALLAAGIAAIAAVSAARSGKEIVAATRDAAKRQLRAYVNCDGINFANFDASPLDFSPPLVHVKIKNFGQSPAYDVRYGIQYRYTTSPDEGEAPNLVDEDWSYLGVLSPNSFIGSVIKLSDPDLSHNHKAALLSGDATFFVKGAVHYRDAFNDPHSATFKMKFGGTAPTDAEYSFALCEDGNEAD